MSFTAWQAPGTSLNRGPSMIGRIYKNSLLSSFTPDIIMRLQLRPVLLPLRFEIEFPGKPIRNLLFRGRGNGIDDHYIPGWFSGRSGNVWL